ncbi:tetratricopeptide repeat protein [Paraherbaspirillum soli]|uniref:protein O-GlcNAc transferase n=1 Tax=Paraherbaspirillum soli TaxID=631222 RepID=A0ABW0MFX1_9BURK
MTVFPKPSGKAQPSPQEIETLVTLTSQGRAAEAETLARDLTGRFPRHGWSWKMLGSLLQQQGRLEQALLPLQTAAQCLPQDGAAHGNLGIVLKALGRLAEAEASYQRALKIMPASAELHNNLGNTLNQLGRKAEAEASYRRALKLKPAYAEAHSNLGTLLQEQDRFTEAEASYRQALELKPQDAVAHCNLGALLRGQGRYTEAEARYLRALELKPDDAVVHGNLGALFQDQGRLSEAEASLRRVLQLRPDDVVMHSTLLFTLSHNQAVDAAALFAEHRRFGQHFEAPLRAHWTQHGNSRDAERCLQVGFVSGDLRSHAMASFIEPVLAQLAAYPNLSLHAYSNHATEDDVSRRLRGHVSHWHSIVGLSDAALAEKIRADRIDILIDLSGHTSKHRLLTFARKPAPVQASWMGYPGTTGLVSMDYYLTDRCILPPGQLDSQFTEKLVHLPANAPFLPSADAPPVNALPALDNGYLTFGSFNRQNKLSRAVIALWSQLLRALPDARMVLGAMPQDGQYDALVDWFAAEGIARERLDFYPRSNMQDYLALHHRVDFCLDTFPYNGGTTTLHALWMGVPTLTLAGNTVAGRTGAGILGHVGLDAFVAQDAAAFVKQGLSLAADVSALAELRTGLRQRFEQSAPSQPGLIAAGLERALRTMWQRWCAGLPAVSFEAGAKVQNATQSSQPSAQQQLEALATLYSQGRFAEAETLARALTAADPQHGFGWKVLGAVLQQQGRLEQALLPMQTAAALLPQDVETHSNLGITLTNLGRLSEAEASYRRALELQPTAAEAHNNLGVTLKNQGRLSEAEARYRRALELKPAYAEAHSNLGNIHKELGRTAEAEASYRQALQIAPNYVEGHNNLGVLLQQQGRLSEAEASYRGALELKPHYADGYNNLGSLLQGQGRLAEAEASLRQALQLKPQDAVAHSSLLFCMSHNQAVDAAALFAEHCRFGEQFEAPLRAHWPQHDNPREPERCLQVGLVSGDLRNHAMASFIEPVLVQLRAHAGLALHVYANHASEDEVTQRLRGHVAHWHPVASLSDAALAEKIRADRIDLLIDLSGHTDKHRLLTFARKPAPLQMSWMGYPGTTGLVGMDYYLSDRCILPPGQFDHQFTEKLVHLPANAPFLPSADAPAVNDLPALSNGYLTFGSFNRPSKLSRAVIALWSHLLRAMPDARMVLGAMREDGQHEELVDWFAAEGIVRERLDFYPRSNMQDYLALHQQVDICLDTFPYNGGTTTLHALWMGVPTLTLAGDTVAARTGAGILGQVGLDAFVAQDAAAFVQQGLSLAADVSALAELRAGLRQRFEQSPTSQPALIAAGLERALRTMWQRWCVGLPAVSFEAALPAAAPAALPAKKMIDALVALYQQGKMAQVETLAEAITKSFPQHGFSWKMLGVVRQQQGRLEQALLPMQKAAQLLPQDAEAQRNLGLTLSALGAQLRSQGRLQEAAASYRQALQLMPAAADLHHKLANTLKDLGRPAQAEASYRQALAIAPDDADLHNNLGSALKDLGRLPEAEAAFRQALALKPAYAEAHNNLGATLQDRGLLDEAEARYRQALQLKPDYVKAHCNLGALLQGQGRYVEAQAALRQALTLAPDYAEAHSNLLFCMSHSEQVDAAAMLAEQRRFCEQFETPLRPHWPQHDNPREAGRCLQIGFVSGDLRNHAAASFIEPVWAQLAAYPNLSLHAYSNHATEDSVTERLRGYVGHWHSVVGLSDAALAEKIRADRIDILFDLSSHTAHNRLLSFARKPAPLQVSWIGFPGSTGLDSIDYYLTDRFFLPPGQYDHQFTEKLVYLPASAPFLPSADAPPVNDLPALKNGYLTFGSFNRPSKLSRAVIALWSHLLRALPDARMVLGAMREDGQHEELVDWFAAEGIARERLDFYPRSNMQDYLALHHRVDVCLDTFPYNGGTTTLHALWMGVPTLTLAGDTVAGRTGAGILGHVGLDALVAYDAADFVQKGLALAADLPALASLRAVLRDGFAQADSCQPALIGAGLERALRTMWQRWCDGLPAVSFDASAPPPAATPAMEQALQELAQTLDSTLQLAVNQHQSGQLAEAENLYRAILDAQPQHAGANYHLGLLAVQMKQAAAALPYLAAALEAQPEQEHYWLSYIDALIQAEQLDTARQVLALGQQHGLQGAAVDALAAQLEQQAWPSAAEIHALVALYGERRLSEAETLSRALTVRFPGDGFGWKVLGVVLQEQGQLQQALAAMQTAADLLPQDPEAHSNLGNTFKYLGCAAQAEASYSQALAIRPQHAAAHANLGALLQEQGRLLEAETHYRQALALKPEDAVTHSNLGTLLRSLGRLTEAEAALRQALALKPHYAEAHSNLLFCISHNEAVDAAALLAEHRRFGEQFEAPLRAHWPQHDNPRDPQRCLQVGLVSGDLRDHAMASFIEPVLAQLSAHSNLSLHAYANHATEDEVTQRLRSHVAHWHPVAALSDAALAEKIRADRIDLLIDLSGHTADNRLLTFARKPAPLQMSWMGYPGTTGLSGMDYFLSDRCILPPGQFDHQFTEKLVHLPANAPFLPSPDAPPVNALPALNNGYLTFGSFNRPSKLSRAVIALWSQLLRAMPDARMLLAAMPQDGQYGELVDWFAAEGIARERLDFYPRSSMQDYLALHRRVDVCLDTFPYNGGTTTLHALWMGVPTLTLAGDTVAGRTGAGILGHVGLEAWVAQDAAGFVQQGLALAADVPALAELRAGLRQRFEQSVPNRPALIAAGLEHALRTMWQRWCAGLSTESFEVNHASMQEANR